MTFTPKKLQLSVPPTNEMTLVVAKKYLVDFICWLDRFCGQLDEHRKKSFDDMPLFETELVDLFHESLIEIHKEDHFVSLQESIQEAKGSEVKMHGLRGAQLRWKLSIIDFHWGNFFEKPSASKLEKLLSCINSLLGSLQDAIGLGYVIKELVEAIQHILALVNNSVDNPNNEGNSGQGGEQTANTRFRAKRGQRNQGTPA